MSTQPSGASWKSRLLCGGLIVSVVGLASLATVSAHVIRGLVSPTLATAFVSSPTASADAPVKLAWGTRDTQLRVACFYAANTSPARLDTPGWPQMSAIGFELPGQPSGFALLEPLDGDWSLVERQTVTLADRGAVSLDFVLVPRANPTGTCRHGHPHPALGIEPGQAAVRGSGQRFCVSGPFPDGLTIEQIIDGVVTRFHRVQSLSPTFDHGVWENPARVIPLYP